MLNVQQKEKSILDLDKIIEQAGRSDEEEEEESLL